MSSRRPLRGGCQCGRNSYIINVPGDAALTDRAQVLFHTDSTHTAMIRVPLSWYRSSTHAFFPDESNSSIRRVFENTSSHPSKRYFCGFCGTPLSYWTERPTAEADYIHLTLASLCGEDLRDLEALGLIPDLEKTDEQPVVPTTTTVVGREIQGVPWFESMIEGTRLGSLRHSHGADQSRNGSIRVEWEIVEWTDADDGNNVAPGKEQHLDTTTNQPGKRKLHDRDDTDADAVGGGMH
ncbi:hypothetical protein CCHL11_05491 [Colletotrichum chlorophyti]|uniref:CENP-V/GFA domain-containing protein n=1 Tax=Colletotrichum chlorophyti TaxID=708187 RepID=A0A1Q8RBW9_9PEZI|nr:hypothetical protein CCHL11_05491 [Colletotrichum chlorophyti]